MKALQEWKIRGKGLDLGSPPFHLAALAFNTSIELGDEDGDGHIGLAWICATIAEYPEAERLIIKAINKIQQSIDPTSFENTMKRIEIGEIYYYIAKQHTGILLPMFLAKSIKYGGKILITISSQRQKELLQLVEQALSIHYTNTLPSTKEDFILIADILDEIEERELAKKCRILLM
jgi:hypothetical protein